MIPDTGPWAEAGEFFARSVFGVLGSFLVVSKVQEWCVPVDARKIKGLVEEINAEIDKVKRAEVKNENALLESIVEHYENIKKDAQTMSDKMESKRKWFVRLAMAGMVLLTLIDVILLCTGLAAKWGVFTLLLLISIPVVRNLSANKYKKINEQAEGLIGIFRQKKQRYQAAYEANEESAWPKPPPCPENAEHRAPFPEGPACN